jgi:DNA-binding transcriptional ArsR family regulator
MRLTQIRAEAIRFEFSPLQETLRALHVLGDPRHHAQQMGWVRGARRRMSRDLVAELRRFRPLLQPAPELFPDLLPAKRTGSFAGELALLARNRARFRAAVVRRVLAKPLLGKAEIAASTRPAVLAQLVREASTRDPAGAAFFEAFLASDEQLLRELCTFLQAFFERCLAAQWPELERRARDDSEARRRLLERFGVAAMLRTLTRAFNVGGDRRTASIEYTPGGHSAHARDGEPTIALTADATVALTPSYFIWPHASLVVLRGDTLRIGIAYPLPSPSTMRLPGDARERSVRQFAALSDPTRLEMLQLLRRRDLSTRELAGFLGISESGASRHLSILRAANLVTSVRDGYFVLYARCDAGFEHLLESVTAL